MPKTALEAAVSERRDLGFRLTSCVLAATSGCVRRFLPLVNTGISNLAPLMTRSSAIDQ